MNLTTITPFLWFDRQAEEAAEFYTSLFPDSRIDSVQRFPEGAGVENQGNEPGSAMTVSFVLAGRPFTALNGGPQFSFTEAVSFSVSCADQSEIDRYWKALCEGGPPESRRCGWLKDRFGLSWQIVPAALPELLEATPGPVMEALLGMEKIDLPTLESVSRTEG